MGYIGMNPPTTAQTKPLFFTRNTSSFDLQKQGLQNTFYQLFEYKSAQPQNPIIGSAINPIHVSQDLPIGLMNSVDVIHARDTRYAHEHNYSVVLALSPELTAQLGDKISFYVEHTITNPDHPNRKTEYVSLNQWDEIRPEDRVLSMTFGQPVIMSPLEYAQVLDSAIIFEEGERKIPPEERRGGQDFVPNQEELRCIHVGELAAHLIQPLLLQDGRLGELAATNQFLMGEPRTDTIVTYDEGGGRTWGEKR